MRVRYYRQRDGRQPVQEFIESLRPARRQEAIRNQTERLDMLYTDEPPPEFPASSQIRGQLRELRCHFGGDLYRILYRRSENLFILLHAFEKTTDDVPENEIQIAEARWNDFRARMDRPPPRRPSPAGREVQ